MLAAAVLLDAACAAHDSPPAPCQCPIVPVRAGPYESGPQPPRPHRIKPYRGIRGCPSRVSLVYFWVKRGIEARKRAAVDPILQPSGLEDWECPTTHVHSQAWKPIRTSYE